MKVCNHCFAEIADTARFCPECGASAAESRIAEHHLSPGTMLNGRFLIGAVLGEGGFGITYIARDLQNTREKDIVAIKEFYPTGFATRNGTVDSTVRPVTGERERRFFENGKDRFLKEAQTLLKLANEPGIVRVRDFFEGNNTAYIVMEYLDGETLKAFQLSRDKIDYRETYRILRPVMQSLAKVHEMGLIHRDIAPDNIMLTKNGARLLDFGAAREVFSLDTMSLTVMLKAGYTPEEQYSKRGKQGPWTDVYAICATMYRCITGQTPLDAISRREEPLKLPSELGENIDPQFEAVLAKGLAVRRTDRYQTLEELTAAFDACVAPPQKKKTPTEGWTETLATVGMQTVTEPISTQQTVALPRQKNVPHAEQYVCAHCGMAFYSAVEPAACPHCHSRMDLPAEGEKPGPSEDRTLAAKTPAPERPAVLDTPKAKEGEETAKAHAAAVARARRLRGAGIALMLLALVLLCVLLYLWYGTPQTNSAAVPPVVQQALDAAAPLVGRLT